MTLPIHYKIHSPKLPVQMSHKERSKALCGIETKGKSVTLKLKLVFLNKSFFVINKYLALFRSPPLMTSLFQQLQCNLRKNHFRFFAPYRTSILSQMH